MFSENIFVEKNRVWGVAEVNFAVKQLLEANVPLLWVRGEISNLLKAASGHLYFSLKDDAAQVRCVMFRHKNQWANYTPANGQAVEVLAAASLYEQRGDYQLLIEQMRPAGQGALFERFEQLKQLLAGQGLFAAERKQPIPHLPARIGVVTSPQAAALRDVLTTLRQRLPRVPVVLYPTAVQGAGSAEKIAAAIKLANRRAECDVLIVCRGGGSIEDLWAFNEECVARAIAASGIPVISGIGHETDFTIADFVADERAATPTAAAQRALPDRRALLAELSNLAQHLARSQTQRLYNTMQRVDFLQRRLVHPARQVARQGERLAQLQHRLQRALRQRNQQQWHWQAVLQRFHGIGEKLVRRRESQVNLAQRLLRAAQSAQLQRAARLNSAAQQLAILNPQQVLARGYSLVQDARGEIVRDVAKLPLGAALTITFAKGRGHAELKDKG
ncbi:MAG: exodeoxyribonuclease VII large subunit [Pseudomonadota bacterium]